nr:hypothetical protein [Tanacetum cinerariifolium]
VRAATTAFNLEAKQESGSIDKTQSKVTPNEANSPGTTSGGGPWFQEAIRDTIAQTRFENVSKLSNDSLLARARVDSSEDEQSLGDDASKQERKIHDIDADKDIILVNDQDDAEMFDVNDLQGEEVFVEKEVSNKEVNVAGEVNAASIATAVSVVATITSEEVTLVKALEELKLQNPRTKIYKTERDKKELEAKNALIETWDDVQAKIDVDYQMAERLQAEEQQELTNEEKATLFMQLLKKKRKFFAAKRLVEGSSKRAGEELTQESAKKQKVDDDKETTELKKLMEIIQNEEEVAIIAIPLAVKSPKIVDWKIHKEGKKSYYQIIRADRNSKMYMGMIVGIKSHLNAVGIAAAHIDTVRGSYYCQYKEVTAAQVEVSAAQEL